jgi:glycosyltransferase involved in cell wall biosynthesis
MKPRICYVIPSMAIGGSERQLLHLIQGVVVEYDVHVVCTREAGALAGQLPDGVSVDVLECRGGWDWRLKARLREVFAKRKPELVHSFMFGFDYAVNVAAKDAGVRAIVSSRRQLATWKKPRHIRLQKRANALVDAIVANSRAVARFSSKQEERPLEDYEVILNGIDVDLFQSTQDSSEIRNRFDIRLDKRVVGMVANYSPVKNHDAFLAMASILRETRSDLHFVLVGRGDLIGAVEAHIIALDLERQFTLIETIDNPAEAFALMDVAVLTSKSEGFPNVVMEAMASRTPMIASKVGGIPELIEHGKTGLLIDSGSPEKFALEVGRCLDDKALVEDIISHAETFVRENCSIESLVMQTLHLYGRLL